MTRFSYREQDYAFGQALLTLRTAIGLTQAGLADHLGVSRQAVGDWEAGSSHPKAKHLKAFIALAVERQVFHAGHEANEIRTFWKAARQKVLLDETWLTELLSGGRTPSPVEAALAHEQAPNAPRLDWGDAVVVPNLYGREQELATLSHWIVQERCRVVSVMGMGGIGKSSLVVQTMYQLAAHFQAVIFRSLRNSPPCEALLDDLLQALTPQAPMPVLTDLPGRISLLLNRLREQRVLLVLDNANALLEEGSVRGRLRPGVEGYARLLREVAETAHQSCLLLTTREKFADLRILEGRGTPVHSLRLDGLDASACAQLFDRSRLVGSPREQARLAERYGGNPLALKIVAETILDLFEGEIGPFVAQDTLVFGSIADLIKEQVERRSGLELTVLRWLAIARKPITLEALHLMLVTPPSPAQMLEAIDGLRRCSLVERGHQTGTFTLHPVLLEYVTTSLVADAAQEIQQGQLVRLREHGFSQARTEEYVRQAQYRLLVKPVLVQLQGLTQSQLDIERRLLALLDPLRGCAEDVQGYGPANLVTLLHLLRGYLGALDLSDLYLRDTYLRGIEMQDSSLARTTLRDPAITETIEAVWSVAISQQGTYWAAGDRRGEIRVWRENGRVLHLSWLAHSRAVHALAFSPDERLLISGGWDGVISVWDVNSGALLWRSAYVDSILSLAFAPDGRTFASAGMDAIVRLWNARSGVNYHRLSGHRSAIFALAWHPDGSLLASGGFDGQIRLWEVPGDSPQELPSPGERVLTGHTNVVMGMAFAPDGRTLASASWDRSLRLWDVPGAVERTHHAMQSQAGRVAWSPDGRVLAMGDRDRTIWLWDMEQDGAVRTLGGHSAWIRDLAFTPDSRSLFSASDDRTLRVWDIDTGRCMHIMQAYAISFNDVAWSPDGTQLASARSDALVTLWDAIGDTPPRELRSHSKTVYGVTWSPDGRWLASSGEDNAVRVWDVTAASEIHTFRDLDHDDTLFFGSAWSPDGQRLAAGSLQQGIGVWNVAARTVLWLGRTGFPARIMRVAWSPDGRRLASCGEDGNVLIWDGLVGTLLDSLQGLLGAVMTVAWSSDGRQLASGGGTQGRGEIVVWNTANGKRLHSWNELSAMVLGLAWSPGGDLLVSAGSDGIIRWWDLKRGESVRELQGHQAAIQSLSVSPDGHLLASCAYDGSIRIWNLATGEHRRTLRHDRPYERLDITGIRGLTEAQKATMLALGAIEVA